MRRGGPRPPATLWLAGLTASWGLVAVLAASVELGAATLVLARLMLATATIGVTALLLSRSSLLRPGGRLPALVALGAVQALHWLLFFEAVKRGSVALAVIAFYTAPLLLALLAPVLVPERVSRVALAALVPGTAGVVLVALTGDEGGGAVSGIALAAGLGSAVTYAGLVIGSKRLLQDHVEPLTIAFWDCLAGSVAVAPVFLLAGGGLPDEGGEWGAVLLLGVVFTGLSTLAYTSLLRRVSAQAAGVLTFLEPVAAVALAALLLGDELGAATLLGGALVVVAGLLVVLLEPAGGTAGEAPAGVGSAVP